MDSEQGGGKVRSYGRYVIESEIGRGSMGVVYRARDPEIDRPVALKVLRHDRVGDKDMVRRFFREAKAAGRLSHPNIVVVYDVGQDHGTVFIAMELVQGDGLEKLIKAGPVDPERALDLCIQAALALDYAHKHGIVHRDVKPSNIIVTPGGRIKITDFGIARIQDTPSTEQTQAGSILGTPAYMSPEQVRGERVDGRSDLFSLGTILYEMLCGQKPFKGGNIVEVFQSISTASPPPLSACGKGFPDGLEEVVQKALAKEPGKRFQSGEEFSEALKTCAGHGKGALAGDLTARAASAARPSASTSRSRLLPLALATAVLLLLAIAIFIWRPWVQEEGPGKRAALPVTPGESVATGNLSVVSDPPGAQVVVDGKARGTTPLDLALEPGTHEVTLNKKGYFTWEAEIRIKSGGVVPLEVEMVSEGDM